MTTPTGKSHTGPVGPRFKFPRSNVPEMSLTVGRLTACDGDAISDNPAVVSMSSVRTLRMCVLPPGVPPTRLVGAAFDPSFADHTGRCERAPLPSHHPTCKVT